MYLYFARNRQLRNEQNTKQIYSVSKKSSPLKLFAVFSLLMNLCN